MSMVKTGEGKAKSGWDRLGNRSVTALTISSLAILGVAGCSSDETEQPKFSTNITNSYDPPPQPSSETTSKNPVSQNPVEEETNNNTSEPTPIDIIEEVTIPVELLSLDTSSTYLESITGLTKEDVINKLQEPQPEDGPFFRKNFLLYQYGSDLLMFNIKSDSEYLAASEKNVEEIRKLRNAYDILYLNLLGHDKTEEERQKYSQEIVNKLRISYDELISTYNDLLQTIPNIEFGIEKGLKVRTDGNQYLLNLIDYFEYELDKRKAVFYVLAGLIEDIKEGDIKLNSLDDCNIDVTNLFEDNDMFEYLIREYGFVTFGDKDPSQYSQYNTVPQFFFDAYGVTSIGAPFHGLEANEINCTIKTEDGTEIPMQEAAKTVAMAPAYMTRMLLLGDIDYEYNQLTPTQRHNVRVVLNELNFPSYRVEKEDVTTLNVNGHVDDYSFNGVENLVPKYPDGSLISPEIASSLLDQYENR